MYVPSLELVTNAFLQGPLLIQHGFHLLLWKYELPCISLTSNKQYTMICSFSTSTIKFVLVGNKLHQNKFAFINLIIIIIINAVNVTYITTTTMWQLYWFTLVSL